MTAAEVTGAPGRPMAGAPRLERALGGLAGLLVLAGLYVAVFVAPAERVLGETVRILYVHAGAAWTAYLAYAVAAAGSVGYLWRRDRRWDRVAVASAELGVVLTAVTLGTGMLWGKVAQGWWWRWDDPRLVITLFMGFLYVAYLVLRQYTAGEARARLSAVLAIVGLPVMVLNHFAVTLWNRYHPRPIFGRPDGAAVEGGASEWIVYALALSFLAYTALYVYLMLGRVRLEVERDAAAAPWAVGE
ncbi:MAG: hypothetical protein DYG90_08400 [Chloroflexi bacterium CFX6]|nr:hypothetical protein [Chloroflexi bacterium CFX6]